MNSLYGQAALVRKSRTVISDASRHHSSRISLDPKLGHIGGPQPFGILAHNLHDFGRLAVDRDLARPRQHWSAILTGVEERSTIFFLISLGEVLFLAAE